LQQEGENEKKGLQPRIHKDFTGGYLAFGALGRVFEHVGEPAESRNCDEGFFGPFR
jgi:hypothetical protein